jgi:hypothetical protein
MKDVIFAFVVVSLTFVFLVANIALIFAPICGGVVASPSAAEDAVDAGAGIHKW